MADHLHQLQAALADRYDLECPIGRGGMATVYQAHDRKHDRLVAIKVLHPELAATLGGDRFLREIQIAAKLHHPHILALYDSGEANGFLYYVMPLAEGETLRERLDREKQLPVEEALRIAREVADALSYAHEHEVIHRDVKPENIMLEWRHAVVADFGIARAISEAGGERLTETGIAVGTPAYMSPEQAAGSPEVDQRSDVYALARLASAQREWIADQTSWIGTMTPRETGTMLEAIARGTATSDENSDRMQEIMMRQQAGARRIPHFLTSTVAHKTGDLLNVANDVGIVYAQSGPIIISFFSTGIEEPYGEFEDRIGRIVQLIVNYFDGVR